MTSSPLPPRIGHSWAEHAPHDGVLVTAAAPAFSPALSAQPVVGGRLVAPLGTRWTDSTLAAARKRAYGELAIRPILPVAFVPLVTNWFVTSRSQQRGLPADDDGPAAGLPEENDGASYG